METTQNETGNEGMNVTGNEKRNEGWKGGRDEEPRWGEPGIFPDEEPDAGFEGKFEALMCECHEVFDPLNQILWSQAQPTAESYPITLSGCQASPKDGILMHAFFRLITKPIAEQLPDFRPLHLLRKLEQEMLAQSMMEYGTLTDALHYCNVGFDTLPLALKAYEKSHPVGAEELHLTLLLDTLPRFFNQQVDASQRDRLLDDMEFSGECYSEDYVTCPGLEDLVPDFLQEMRHVLRSVIESVHVEED